MYLQIILFFLGLFLLLKGADWLVNGSVSLSGKLKVPELVIGLTVVAFGTSTPELVVNVVASVNKYNDIVMGNIIGSNIFNLLLILGLSAVIFPITVKVKTIRWEIPFSLLIAVMLLILLNDNRIIGSEYNSLQRTDGLVLILFFLFFLFYVFKNLKSEPEEIEIERREYSMIITVLLIAAGLTGLVLGGNLVVSNGVKIARFFGISERIIGLTIISAGTSLPELFTSAVAAYKKRSDLAIGNVIGSNIFNICLVLGISAVISPVKIAESFNADILLLIAGTLLLILAMFTGIKNRFDRWEGALFVLLFILYISWLIL